MEPTFVPLYSIVLIFHLYPSIVQGSVMKKA